MTPSLVSGSANPLLGDAIASILGVALTECDLKRFPDGELRPSLCPMEDGDVYVLQPTGPPVNDHLVELLLLLDACRRAGARRITAVLPYLGYARQDRRSAAGQSVGAQVVARAITVSGADRVIVVDSHTPAVETLFDVPVAMLTAVPVLAAEVEGELADETVIVAPDLGAVKLAEHYGSLLGKPVVIVRKTRQSGSEVSVEEVVGQVEERPVMIVDDMISTGATVRAAAEAVLERGAVPELAITVTHGLLLDGDRDGSHFPKVDTGWVTDSLVSGRRSDVTVEVVSIASLLADAIDRLHRGRPLDDLLMRQ